MGLLVGGGQLVFGLSPSMIDVTAYAVLHKSNNVCGIRCTHFQRLVFQCIYNDAHIHSLNATMQNELENAKLVSSAFGISCSPFKLQAFFTCT